FVDVDGPKGLNFEAVSMGRLDVPENQKGKIKYGINKVLPLVETRSPFSLDLWELDNAARGAKDLNLDTMEEAAHNIGEFEEKLIYNGFPKANITGLKDVNKNKPAKYPEKVENLPEIISRLIGEFVKSSVEGPYSLILNTGRWEKLSSFVNGYPLKTVIKDLIGGNIILAPAINDAFLVSTRGGDFKLTIGQDLSIGYQSHDHKNVNLYFMESFTFQIIEPAAVIKFA
ncbi:MAG: family 1 encapsulin nanocompartment shell protein, partial [Ignavibacteriaceae bacterium]